MALAVSEFKQLLSTLGSRMQVGIDQLVANLSGLDQKETLSAVTDVVPGFLEAFINAAADLTAVWYEAQDPDSDFIATPADSPALEALAALARWAMLQEDPAGTLGRSASGQVFDASRNTVEVNAKREGVKWVRQASPDACGFCRLLAVRAHTDTKGHSGCSCVAVPVRKEDYVAPDYIQQWERDYKVAKRLARENGTTVANELDYLPGGRRYKVPPVPQPVNLDVPAAN